MPWYIITGKEDREQREQIGEAIRKISRELNNLGLELEPKKTNLVKFEETEEEITEIEVQGSKYQEREVKFLKLIFDKRLAFDTQIELTRDKMMKANNLLKYMNGINKGMEINTAKMLYKSLYKSLVRATFDYGCNVFFPRKKTKRIRLERAQYQGLRTALGYRMSTPTNIILKEDNRPSGQNDKFNEESSSKNHDMEKRGTKKLD